MLALGAKIAALASNMAFCAHFGASRRASAHFCGGRPKRGAAPSGRTRGERDARGGAGAEAAHSQGKGVAVQGGGVHPPLRVDHVDGEHDDENDDDRSSEFLVDDIQ